MDTNKPTKSERLNALLIGFLATILWLAIVILIGQ
jgi:hypothetical protein